MTDIANQKISMPLGLRLKLSAMMFLPVFWCHISC